VRVFWAGEGDREEVARIEFVAERFGGGRIRGRLRQDPATVSDDDRCTGGDSESVGGGCAAVVEGAEPALRER
jgi:hypothetical protein